MISDNTIFDDVFRTLLEKMPHLVIPLINEVFHTTYDENTVIVQLRNEHQTKTGDKETDSCMLIENKLYHMECQSNPDSTMSIRMIEYDFSIALEYAVKEDDSYTLEFPRSCVLYLRHTSNTKDELKTQVRLPDGETFTYTIPIIKVQNYTKDMIFQKKLLFLLPFYVMRYEKEAEQIENNNEELAKLLEEYEDICQKLMASLDEGHQRDYSDLIILITRISDYIFRKNENARKGMKTTMRGKLLDLPSDKINRAFTQGKIQGEIQGNIQGNIQGRIQGRIIALYSDANFTPEQIAEKTGDTLEKITQILQEEHLLPETANN